MICNKLTREQSNKLYKKVLEDKDEKAMKRLCTEDLFFLLTIAFKRPDINNQWLYERVREVEASPDGHLDLWARCHYKSTIITYGLTIQDILKNPEVTIGLFSHTAPIAKGFLGQIKREFEANEFLKALFPEILYSEPGRESSSWSLDGGLIVKRKSNPKEPTIMACGLVEGQPISKHYDIMIYDDAVVQASVTTPEQALKTVSGWELSLNLGTKGGRTRYIGTRYAHGDLYKTIIERGAARPRLYPATDDGTVNGKPVFLSQEDLDTKKKEMGPFTFSAQLLQDPTASDAQGFDLEWLRYYDILKNTHDWNYYIVADLASAKKKHSDYSAILVIALATDKNYYLIDGVYDRLNLTERTQKIMEFHRMYSPLQVGIEKYGVMADIEHLEFIQQQEGYRFNITPLGGQVPKADRIRKLIPIFEQGRFYLPHRLLFVNYERKTSDLVKHFLDEYTTFPLGSHDDAMDSMARIVDPKLEARFPEKQYKHPHGLHANSSHDTVETDYDLFG